MLPSKYQKVIYNFVEKSKKSIKVQAVAGSGKTTTLIECFKLIPRNASSIYLAYNNHVVKEFKKKNLNSSVEISTLHSLGWRALAKHYRGPKLDVNKVSDKIAKYCNKKDIPWNIRPYYFYVINKLVNLMRNNLCFDIDKVEELAYRHDILCLKDEIEIALAIFEACDNDKKKFDFADMVYQPAIDDKIRMVKYDYVFVDESQDLSTAQIKLISRILKPDTRVIAVGDINQAIYGFAGSDVDSYKKISTLRDNFIELPLSVCYRCSKAVVEHAKDIVKQIEPFDGNIQGSVRMGELAQIRYGDWVLCRNTKPLVSLCVHLIKCGIKAKVKGRDIGRDITALVKKAKASTIFDLKIYMNGEYLKAKQKLAARNIERPERHPKLFFLQEKIELILVLCKEVQTVKELIDFIDGIFSDDIDGIVLSTIHKAKGLENERIFLILPELMPNQFAVQEWQIQQETNLHYVAITRAKKEFIYVDEGSFKQGMLTKFSIPKQVKVIKKKKKT